jgi:MFS family permease
LFHTGKSFANQYDPTEVFTEARSRRLLFHLPAVNFIFACICLCAGYSIATPAIPVFAKSFDTGFGVASLVIVVHALGGLIAAVPTGVLVDRTGRRPILIAGPILVAAASCLTALAQSFAELLVLSPSRRAPWRWRQARLAIIADIGKRSQRAAR